MQVDASSIKLVVTQQPKNFQASFAQGTVRASCSALQVDATCTVLASGASPSPAPNPRFAAWKLGFMQLRILETSWAYYRGAQVEGRRHGHRQGREADPGDLPRL